MNLFDIIKSAPKESQLITDSIVITHAKLQQYNNILCSVSGGSDSDILVDLCQKFDDSSKITYAFFDTGLEFQARRFASSELFFFLTCSGIVVKA